MIVAGFGTAGGLSQALRQLRAAQVGPIETYTPAPLEGEDTASPLPLVVLVAGLLGAAASLGMQAYSSLVAFPLDIGGRPDFAWISFVPTVFENAVLLAVAAGFVGFLLINRLPRLWEPVDEAEALRRASSDRWCLAVHSADPQVLERARAVLRPLEPESIEELAP